MKKIILFIALLLNTVVALSQCAFNNTLVSTVTPTCPGTTTVPCVNGGQYVSVNVVTGNNYVFSTCGGATWDTQISLYNAAGTTSYGYSDDACGLQSSVSWTATYTGVANVLIDQYYCTNNASCATLTITCSTSGGGSGCIGGSNNTCGTADPFCTGVSYNYCNTTGVASMGTYSCLFTTPNPMWMYLNVSTSGPIDIQLQQFNNSGVGIDVDFALYGPYTSPAAGCSVINGSTSTVDCSYSASYIEYVNIGSAVAGEYYILLITNYANQAGYIQFSQTGGAGVTNCGILPIELLSFYGENKEGYNLLKWSTASEIGNDYFLVEKSENAIDWEKLEILDGAGNSSMILDYKIIDNNPSNTTYYRLTQVDFDGNKETFDPIVVINKEIKKTIVKVTNLMGQDVDENYEGIKIVYYSDGTTMKKVGK